MSRARRTESKPHIALRLTGVLGELMITVGVLVGLFVVWQLWWTDVQAGREQEQALEDLGWTAPPPELVPAVEVPEELPPEIPEPAAGETFASLLVPRFGADYEVTIAEGVGKKEILDTGAVGHYPETALPGALGNFSHHVRQAAQPGRRPRPGRRGRGPDEGHLVRLRGDRLAHRHAGPGGCHRTRPRARER